MRRITPTGWAKQKGTPVEQLGSTEAVLEAMGWEGVLIVASHEAATRAAEIWITKGPASATVLRYLVASGGPALLYETPRDAVLGVDVDAFAGVPGEVWADMQRILTTRFKTVFWG